MKTPNQFNDSSSLSRRQWIGSSLATCGYLAAGGLALGQSEEKSASKGYTLRGPVANLGRAPGLQTRLIGENPSGERTYAVIFAKGDEIMSGLTEFAVREKLVAGHFTAIGALASARFGWFDRAQNGYRNIPIDHQVEMISLIGDVGWSMACRKSTHMGRWASLTAKCMAGICWKPSCGRRWNCFLRHIAHDSSKHMTLKRISCSLI